jgi:hypothetical protein
MRLRFCVLSLSVLFISQCKAPEDKATQGFDASLLSSDAVLRSPIGIRPPGAFISPNELAPSGTTSDLTDKELIDTLASDEVFFIKTPDDDDCPPVDNLIPEIRGTSVELKAEVDYTSCIKASSDPNTRFISMRMQLFHSITCKDSDLSVLRGKTLKQINQITSDQNLCKGEGNTLAKFYNLKATGTLEYAQDGVKKSTKVTILSSSQSDSGASCVQHIRGEYYYHSPCIHVYKSTYGDPSLAASYEKTIERNVVGAHGKPFYHFGEFEFQFANWRGRVTNKGDNVAPSFTATSSSGANTSGMLQYRPDSLSLTNETLTTPRIRSLLQ